MLFWYVFFGICRYLVYILVLLFIVLIISGFMFENEVNRCFVENWFGSICGVVMYFYKRDGSF